MNVKTIFYLILYYGFVRYLPISYSVFGKLFKTKQIRGWVCHHIFKFCGENINVERKAWFGKGTEIVIGDNSGIGINAHILNNTVIGKDVMMGPNCYMLESTHKFERTDISMREQGTKTERDKVVIEDDVWIGKDVLIIGSRKISKGTIIGARCVLTKSFPEYSIIGGNPSRLIRNRKDKL